MAARDGEGKAKAENGANRRAEALRANLKRRKAQARARAATAGPEGVTEGADAADGPSEPEEA